MAYPKLRRRPPLLQALAWFLPGWIAVALAAAISHPLSLLPLLLANTLTMAAVCHAIGFDPEPRFLQTVMRRGAAHLVMFIGYCAVVFVLVAWPMLMLTQATNPRHGAILAAALVLALAALWRVWPAFGLLFVWDDAYPSPNNGSWIFTASARSITFGRHLSREEHFFTHFLPAALAMLVLAFAAVALTGLYGVLPAELRTVAVLIYGIVLLPLGCLVIANRTVRALLCEGRSRTRAPRKPPRPASAVSAPPVGEPALVARAPAPVAPLSEQERTAGTPEQAAALLAATRQGDIERALALVEAGADPNTAPLAADRDQRPALMLAALLPDTQLLRALIAKGADVNRRSGGLTPLLGATRDSWHGRAEAVLTLLSNGADAQLADSDGNTALHGAVLSGEPTVAAMLLDAGASINVLNQAGASPLTIACRAANWPLARFLLERGAKPAPADGEPALVAAAGIADDDPQGVKLLLKHRAAVNAVDQRHRSALMTAAAEGHEQIARALRAAGAQGDLSDRHGSTALMEAAHAGASGIVQLLAEAQPQVHARDSHGRDALTLACQSPHARAETVRALLALGADPKTIGSDGLSALDHAAAAGRWDLVTVLDPQTPLPASLHLDALPGGASTPADLLDALRLGHWAVVSTFTARLREWPQAQLAQLYLELATPGQRAARRWLLEHGLAAEARLQPQLIDDASEAPGDSAPLPPLGRRLFDALLPRLPAAGEALQDLLQAGASPAGSGLLAQALAHLPSSDGVDALLLPLLEGGADLFGTDARGRTPLQLAVAAGHRQIVDALLARGCDPNCRDASGRTPLFAALAHGEHALPLVRALVAHGADPETTDGNGETPLGLALGRSEIERWLDWGTWQRPSRPLHAEDLPAAAAAGAEGAVSRLLELGFAVDARDAQGASALLRACGAGYRAIATILLDAGADPTLAAHSGMTPLAAAVGARRESTVSLLLERSVAPEQRLPGEATALMVAAALGYPEIVELLLTAGAEVDALDARGHGSLHAAAQFCFESSDSLRARRLLDVLLKRGAEVNRADSVGQTPLLLLLGAHQRPGCACDATHLGALVPVLLEAGAQLTHADQRGVTALHACAMHALLSPARVLLARGADRSAADAFGRSAADVARALGYIDIAHELAARNGAIPSVRQILRQPAQPSDG